MIRSGLTLSLLAGVVLFTTPCHLQAGEVNSYTLDTAIDKLTLQISRATVGDKKIRIAILEFQDLSGFNTKFERFIAEELTTRLLQTGKFHGTERSLLNKVIEEQMLSAQDPSDPVYAKEVGRRLNVDAVVTGTVADMGSALRVNARLISTRAGDILAVGGVSIIKDRIVLELRDEEIPLEMRIPGSILIRCKLDGTQVYLDDAYIGIIRNGELLIPKVVPTRHRLKLKKDFGLFTKEIDLRENEKKKIEVFPASLIITCNVDGARVYLQGRKAGKIRDGKIEFLNVLPGEYKIRIKKRYYWDKEERVTVLEKETKRVAITLEKIGLLDTWEASLTTISAKLTPNEEFDLLTGEETEPVSLAQLYRLLGWGGQVGLGFLKAGEVTGIQGEINALLYDVLSFGPFEMYLGGGLFCGTLIGRNWTGLSDEIPEDAGSSGPWFWGWQAFWGGKIFFSSNSALIGNIGYCDYSDLNSWKISHKVSEEEWETLDYPVSWQYNRVEIGGIATKVGLMFKF